MVDRADPALEALTAATFELVRVRRASGARARLVTAACVLGLVGIAGLAVAGRLAEPGVGSLSGVAVAPATAAFAAPDAPRAAAPQPVSGDLIVLTSPAEGDPTITAAELIVQGFLQAEAASLRVSLETDWYRVDEATVLPILTVGKRPDATRHAQFLVRFELSEPRVTVPLVVRVVALDRDGRRLADVQRPFRLGPVLRPTLGDDGLLGGLVFLGG